MVVFPFYCILLLVGVVFPIFFLAAVAVVFVDFDFVVLDFAMVEFLMFLVASSSSSSFLVLSKKLLLGTLKI